MWTRFLLMGAVTILGVEPPSADDLGRWARAGQGALAESADGVQAWVGGLVADWGQPGEPSEAGMCGPGADVPEPQVAASQALSESPDRAFAGIVDEMAARFAADFRPTPAAEVPDLAAVEPLAEAPAFEAELSCLEEAQRAPASMRVGARASKAERLNAAIALTGRALRAWSSLIGQGATIAAID